MTEQDKINEAIRFLEKRGYAVIQESEYQGNGAEPICPLFLFWEGDEHFCDRDNCDYDDEFRDCNEGCRR